MKRKIACGSCALMIVTALGAGTPSGAHEYSYCGGGKTFKSYAHSYNPPDGWPQGMKDAVDLSAQNMTNNSHYNWNKVNSNADAPWRNLGSSDTSIAGQASFQVDCNPSPKKIFDITLYMNFPHFDAVQHSLERKRCTAIHEFGHAAALDHNSLGSGSIMHGNHHWRCHEVLVYQIQTHDNTDINAKY